MGNSRPLVDDTTVTIPVWLRQKLKKLKQGGETYAELLNRLADKEEKRQKKVMPRAIRK
jgi:predicted CopG family antitoxin